MQRRKFIKKTLLGFTGIGIFSGLYAWQIEPFWLDFVKLKMPIANLPNELIGKTLMQISDMHVGNKFDYNFLIKSLKRAKEYKPDFVVYTGDFVSSINRITEFEKLNEVLDNAVLGKTGTIAILGNHDYGSDWKQNDVADRITTMLQNKKITVLRNEHIEMNGLNFIGLDDYWGTNFNPKKAMQNFEKTKANIVLCHNPDVCDLDIWKEFNGWILAGHTHGGQCKPPFLPPLIIPVKNKKYTACKFDLENGKTLYINRALGHLWQIRFNVRPEITIFELENIK